jgi:glucose-6-phosphate isomerase
MDESVGGRYSVWSSVGLSLQIALGADVWSRFLKGAAEMDAHFRDTPLETTRPRSSPCSTCSATPTRTERPPAPCLPTHTVSANCRTFSSSSKWNPTARMSLTLRRSHRANRAGRLGLRRHVGQHSFHQLLHQGMRDSSIEFVAALNAGAGDKGRGRALLANAFAQAEGLLGRPQPRRRRKGVARQRHRAGKAKARPST